MRDKPISSGSVSGPVIAKFWPKVLAWKWPQFARGKDYDFGNDNDLGTLIWVDDDHPSYADVKAAGAEFKRIG